MMDNRNAVAPTAASIELLISSVKDYGIVLLDPRGLVLTWNRGAQEIFRYAADEIVGRPFSSLYPEEDVRAGRCERELAVAREAGRFEHEGARVRKDGSRFVADVVITALRDESGRVLGFGEVARDVTSRRTAEERLRENEERFRLLVTSAKDYAIFALDVQGRVVSWNPGAERIKGYKESEIVGRHFSVFYPPEVAAAGVCEQELVRAVADGRFEDEGLRVRKDGSTFWANVIITPLRDGAGRHVGFSKITRDLTERRRAEEVRIELAKEQVARRKLAEAVQARDDFLTVASHELKTPLHTLGMQLSSGLWLAKGHELPARLERRLEGAQAEVKRLTKLVNNLLDVSRITTSGLAMEPAPVDLVALVKELLERDSDDIARCGSTVALEAPPALVGTWDRFRLDQIVTNLLSNALKYGERKPIEVRLGREGGWTSLSIQDHGVGIDPADHDRVFQRFERAVSSRSYAGFGLGLWIVKEIVRAIGGRISIQSAKGQGATFRVELPNEQAAPAGGDGGR